jgi:hypothetical protein
MSRLKYTGHIQRMSGDIPRRIMVCKPEGRRRIGIPKIRWIDGVLKDIKELGVKNWWTVARNMVAWRKVFLEAKAYIGLLSY